MPSKRVWKRRERTLAGGIVLWALLVSGYATLQPETVATFLTTEPPAIIAGSIMASVGLCGGFTLACVELAEEWFTAETEGLTSWEGER